MIAVFGEPAVPLPAEGSLWELRIEQWGSERFSGLLALRALEETKLSAVLLDPTGLKLLTAVVAPTGPMTVSQVVKPVADRQLPEHLNKAMQRVFFQPAEEARPCRQEGLVRICRENPAPDIIRKQAAVGPIPIWSVEYTRAPEGAPGRFERALVRNHWTGISMSFQTLVEQEKNQ